MAIAVSKPEKAIAAKILTSWRRDPSAFAVEAVGLRREYIWEKMREVGQALVDHQLVIVPAGHSVSKTFNAGQLAVWFKTCFQPSTVVTTAPSGNQVEHQLWREIRGAIRGARVPLGGQMSKLTTLKWEMPASDEFLTRLPVEERGYWEKNFAIGFSTSPDTVSDHASKMQGYHNKWVLLILDEGPGIAGQIWRSAMDGLVTNENVKVLAIGNPTDPECEFADACRVDGSLDWLMDEDRPARETDQGWWCVPISVFDTPNYKEGREVIPGLAGRNFVERIEKKYPKGSNDWLIRVKGAFPSHREGTYYGHELAEVKKANRVGRYPWDPTFPVTCFSDFGDRWTASIHAQWIRGRWRIISDYWDDEGLGAPEMARAMDSMPYVWGKEHFAGPDLEGSNRRSFQTGRTTQDVLRGLGYNFRAVLAHPFNEGIQATRILWPLLDINEPGAPMFLKAAAGYCKKKNSGTSTAEHPEFHDEPAKTYHRHMADALRHMAVAFRYMSIDGWYRGEHKAVAAAHSQRSGQRRSAYGKWPRFARRN